jgi:thiol-disulfide isomerase/thioredoxin
MSVKNNLSKTFTAGVMLILLFSTLAGLTPSAASGGAVASDSSTHTVFAEFGTATWCGFCKYAHAALKNVYASGLYPFYYVTLVRDVNTHAKDRLFNDYNIYGYPTVFFDGGYRVDVGSGSVPSAEEKYIASIDTCGMRPVPDIEVILLVGWMENATMNIEVSVQNNEPSDYDGHIRVYVTEISSSMGWNDTWGYPYTFTFLDYAFDEDIHINPGDTWQQSMIWDGHEYTDGYGNDFGEITEDNIMVIAVVFNAEWHQGYAYPPDSRPFDAYYVDETAPGLWTNSPPYTPSDPTIEDESTCVDIYADLGWTGGDPNGSDTVTYDVYLGITFPPPLVISNQVGTTYDPGTMICDTTYYWKIVAWDNHDTSTAGPVWSFTTRPELILGDCNSDEEINLSDVVYLINYLFKNGPAPEPIESGNVNCDETVTVPDIVYLINYVLKSGSPPPCYCD